MPCTSCGQRLTNVILCTAARDDKHAHDFRVFRLACRIPLRGIQSYTEPDIDEDEIDAQVIRLTGKYWLR